MRSWLICAAVAATGLAGCSLGDPLGAYQGHPRVRGDLFGLFTRLAPEQTDAWARTFAAPGPERWARLADRASDYGLRQRSAADTAVWLGDDDRIRAMFVFLPDPGDLQAVRDLYDRIADTRSPLTFVIVEQPSAGRGVHDVFRLSLESYLDRVARIPPPR